MQQESVQTTNSRKAKWDQIAALAVGPQEALTFARQILSEDDKSDTIIQTYEAFRDAVWELLASRNYSSDMHKWHDVLRQVGAFLTKGDSGQEYHPTLFRVLSNLVLASAHFGQLHSQASLISEHWPVIQAIEQQGGEATFDEIQQETQIVPSFLRSFVNQMAALGIINRSGYGGDAVLSLP